MCLFYKKTERGNSKKRGLQWMCNTAITVEIFFDGKGNMHESKSNYLVINFLLNRLSYAAVIAKEATKEQSDTTVCRSNKH